MSPAPDSSRTPRIARRRAIAVAGAVAASLALSAIPSLPASAAPADDRGWARLAHLSPDTAAVDIRVTDANGAEVVRLDDFGYGVVSPYVALPEGRYRAALVPAGSPSNADPVLVANVRIRAGAAISALVHGVNADIRATVVADDLTRPAADSARIRVVQMSAGVSAVDVQTSTGVQVASALRQGKATPYLEVPFGPWTLQLAGGGQSAATDVVVADATSSTLFVVDNAGGGLALLPVLDSAATGDEPIGGVATGGGWLAGSSADNGDSDAAASALPLRARPSRVPV